MVTRENYNGKIQYIYLYATWDASIFVIFCVSLTPETPNFGTFVGVAYPP